MGGRYGALSHLSLLQSVLLKSPLTVPLCVLLFVLAWSLTATENGLWVLIAHPTGGRERAPKDQEGFLPFPPTSLRSGQSSAASSQLGAVLVWPLRLQTSVWTLVLVFTFSLTGKLLIPRTGRCCVGSKTSVPPPGMAGSPLQRPVTILGKRKWSSRGLAMQWWQISVISSLDQQKQGVKGGKVRYQQLVPPWNTCFSEGSSVAGYRVTPWLGLQNLYVVNCSAHNLTMLYWGRGQEEDSKIWFTSAE